MVGDRRRICGALGVLVCFVACGEPERQAAGQAEPAPEPRLVGPPVSFSLREAKVGDRIEVEVRTDQRFEVDADHARTVSTETSFEDRVCAVAEGRPARVDRQYNERGPIRRGLDLSDWRNLVPVGMFECLLPDDAVRVGQRWSVDTALAPRPLGAEVGFQPPLRARGTCEFKAHRVSSDSEIAVVGVTLDCRLDDGSRRTMTGEIHFDLRLGEVVRADLATPEGEHYRALAYHSVTAR